MAEPSDARGTASDRLQRILYLLPAASSERGAGIEELCGALGVSRRVLLDDIAEVTAREYYHQAGVGDQLRISFEGDRVQVRTTGEFRRPPRLTAREKLALGLGLRVLAAEREGEAREGLLHLARRLEEGLTSVSEIEFAPRIVLEEASLSAEDGKDDPGAAPDPEPGAEDPTSEAASASAGALRGQLVAAARDRRRCAFNYMKGGTGEPEARLLEPYVVVASAGRWYAVGRDATRDAVRAFRLDRILDLSVSDERFEPDPSFDLDRYLTGAYVYRPPEAEGETPAVLEARIRYAPAIARWILEREEARPLEDGSVVVERVVSDPAWAARHVLRYGGDAELLGPAELRARVAGAARRAEWAHSKPG